MSVGDLIDAGRAAVIGAIETAFKDLLEKKHLYQSVAVDVVSLISGAVRFSKPVSPLDEQSAGNARGIVTRCARARWIASLSREPQMGEQRADEESLVFDVPPVQMVCGKSGRKERYDPVRVEDFVFDIYRRPFTEKQWGLNDQVFVISLLCQACKLFPEVVIVRRVAASNKLVLCGRAPMENVETPPSIPKEESTYYSGAVIAHQSGKTLAGLFYLRTFIEQFARRVLSDTSRRSGQDILADYATTLPETLRSNMPSLAECYEKLSGAIHSAKGGADLFDAMRAKVDQHFAFRTAAGVPEKRAEIPPAE